jgi:hypothetical protein
MSSVNDVLQGQRMMLQYDDVYAVMTGKSNDGTDTYTYVFPLNTQNSAFTATNPPQGENLASTPQTASIDMKLGWLFNKDYQVAARFQTNPSEGTSGEWDLTFHDPVTGDQAGNLLGQPFNALGLSPLVANNLPQPANITHTYTGQFAGNGFDQMLLVYYGFDVNAPAYWRTGHVQFNVVAPQDPGNFHSDLQIGVPQREDVPVQPCVYPGDYFPTVEVAQCATTPVAIGDFNGDGRDEFAALVRCNNQTDELCRPSLLFYSIDPSTLAISKTTSVDLSSLPMEIGFYVANVKPFQIVAGKFRTASHADLAILGDNNGQMALWPVTISLQPGGKFQASLGVAQNLYKTDQVIKILAQAAPIQDVTKNIEQLIFVSDTNTNMGGNLVIGNFDQAMTFKLAGATQVTDGHYGCVYDFSAGNFDSQKSDGSHDPSLQIATYWVASSDCNVSGNNLNPQVRLWKVNPQSTNLNQSLGLPDVTDWLDPKYAAIETPNVSNLLTATMNVGDIQGRSLRLGAPIIARVSSNVQPDLVLGIPPMHVDWIAPGSAKLNPADFPNCQTPGKPCLLNVTVEPTAKSPSTGFQTQFNFGSSTSNSQKRQSTTSWSIGVKTSFQETFTIGDPEESGVSISDKVWAEYTHKNSVSSTYNTYSGTAESLDVTSGWADKLIFSQRRQNIYYYPILGKFACPAANPGCSDADKAPLYVVFSVPDQVTYNRDDATAEEWYQPFNEPGNLFSYPWTFQQLQDEFHSTPTALGGGNIDHVDTSSVTYGVNWTGTTKETNSTASTDKLSAGNDFSVTGQVEIPETPFSVGSSFNLDVTGSGTWKSLNTSTDGIAASEGAQVLKPSFNSDIVNCCSYLYSGYVLGTQPWSTGFDQLTPTDPSGKPPDISSTGPLYVAFTTNPVDPGSAGSSWWRQVYNMPDVGLNHPARWNWNDYQISFNAPFDPVNDKGRDPWFFPFYHMKGFFISPQGDSTERPNLTTAKAGDQLTLTARVYNFSPVATNEGPHPASTIGVRFYGQEWDTQLGTATGDSFFISENQLTSIPAFGNSDGTPNWVLTNVPFDTTPYADKYLVFWVAVWMEDGNGLVPEMPSHGLTSKPPADQHAWKTITDVLVEPYSNNIGVYGTHMPFFVEPQTGLGATQGRPGVVTIKRLSVPKTVAVNQSAEVVTTLFSSGGPADSVILTYYDGNPSHGGTQFALQTITHIEPNSTYVTRNSYRSATCGAHTIFVTALVPGSDAHTRSAPLKVGCRVNLPGTLNAKAKVTFLRGNEGSVHLTFTNEGNSELKNIVLNDVDVKVVDGHGKARILDPFPLNIGNLAAQASRKIELRLEANRHDEELELTEDGALQDAQGNGDPFTLSQLVRPSSSRNLAKNRPAETASNDR